MKNAVLCPRFCTSVHYTHYRNIRNDGFFPVLDCFLNFSFFQYSGFLALKGRFLNFQDFHPGFLNFPKKQLFLQKNLLMFIYSEKATKF